MMLRVACVNLLVHPEPSQLTQGIGFLQHGDKFAAMNTATAEGLEWVQVGNGKHRGKWCVRSIKGQNCLVEVE